MSTSGKQKEAVAQAFGQKLRRHRKSAELTQAELAEKAGVHKRYISQLERGLKVPSIEVAFALCDALGAKAGSFLEQVKERAEKYRG